MLTLRFARLPIALAAALAAPGAALADAPASLGAWQAYALRSVTPDFAWADRPSAAAVEPTLLDALDARTGVQPKVTLKLIDLEAGFDVSVSRTLSGDTPLFESGSLSAQRLTSVGSGLERTFVAPSLTRSVGEGSAITAGVVLAYQQFATWGLGAKAYETTLSPLQTRTSFLGSSYGTGVRLELEQAVGSALSLRTQFQSRIDMSPLQNYRGLYSRPGDFDLPAVASTGLTWGTGNRSALGFGVSRILYSEVAPFTSAALPLRLLGLIGDAGSPGFAWRDLTVYSLDWNWRPSDAATLGFHYTTRQQPEPTSKALRDALAGEFTDDNFGVSLTRQFDRFGSLRFAASYAPAQYFLGNASFGNRDASGEQVEVEAVWAVPF